MSGAAAVISAIGVLADARRRPTRSTRIAACTENMPSGKAYKLGDVLKSMDGKTVEINNTDAEGRLTLGDAITYARTEIKPDEMFDFATLTGACMVALGPYTAGVMGNDLSLVERWLAAAAPRRRGHVAPAAARRAAASSSRARSPTCATPATATAARSPPACS